jgi:hypothetical protein
MANSNTRGNTKLHLETSSALRIFGICGLVGVLVDIDHFIAILLWKYKDPLITEGRIFHTPIFLLVGIMLCYILSHRSGLLAKLVLGLIATATIATLLWAPYTVWNWHG